MLLESQETITPVEAILGIINGMVGSTVLILPVLALQAGYISTIFSIIITGISCAFSSWIYIQHLGEEPDIGHAMKKHFKRSFLARMVYDFSAWLFIVLALIEFFQLIVSQWECVIELSSFGDYHTINIIANGCVILFLVLLLKYWEYGATTMVYGIVSIGIYLAYLLGVIITENRSLPQTKPYKPFGQDPFSMAAAMAQAFLVQVFLIPFLQKLKNKEEEQKNYTKYTFLSYAIGALVYGYIAQIGSFGIVHRQAFWDEEVFGILAYLPSSWQLKFMCLVYTLHLYSVFPEFLLISKKIFFENLENCGLVETSRRSINVQQIIYITSLVGISVLVAFLRIPLEYLMMINGGILGSLIIYIIPSVLHMYCMFFIPFESRQPFSMSDNAPMQKKSKRQSEIEINSFKGKISQSYLSDKETVKGKSQNPLKASLIQSGEYSRIENLFVQCECNHHEQSIKFKVLVMICLIIMMLIGILVMVEAIRETFD